MLVRLSNNRFLRILGQSLKSCRIQAFNCSRENATSLKKPHTHNNEEAHYPTNATQPKTPGVLILGLGQPVFRLFGLQVGAELSAPALQAIPIPAIQNSVPRRTAKWPFQALSHCRNPKPETLWASLLMAGKKQCIPLVSLVGPC